MIVYAESSAVLSWLFGEPPGVRMASVFRSADLVIASVLTGVECSRALVRAAAVGAITKAQARRLGEALAEAEDGWHKFELSDEVVVRARSPFPVEPVRALDAIHLASALIAQEAYKGIVLASLDERVRNNARTLRIPLIPESKE